MGKNNLNIKLGDDKVTKKLYKAKKKWVVQGGLFGAMMLGTIFGTKTADTFAAEDVPQQPAQVTQGGTHTAKVVTLSSKSTAATSTPVSAPTQIAAATAATSTPETGTTTKTPAVTPAPVTGAPTSTTGATASTTTTASTTAATGKTTTSATTSTTPAESTTPPVTSTTAATAANSPSGTAAPVVGSPKSGAATPAQPTAGAKEITLTGAEAKNWFASEGEKNDFDDTGVIQLTGNDKHESAVTFLANRIDMTQDFELKGQINAGNDNGGDGMSIGLHSGDIGKGADGGAVGIGGLENSFGFKVDSYANVKGPDNKLGQGAYTEDPMSDSFAGFVYADPNNGNKAVTVNNPQDPTDSANPKVIKLDDQFKDFSMLYSASNKELTVLYDGELWTKDITNWLNGETYWNLYVSASTGGSTNNHQFKLNSLKYTPEYWLNVDYFDKDNSKSLTTDSNGSAIIDNITVEKGADGKSFEYTINYPVIDGYVPSDVSKTPITKILDENHNNESYTLEYSVDPATAKAKADAALKDTAPVSNETPVKTAKENLENELQSTKATAGSIDKLAVELTNATIAAGLERKAASDNAEVTVIDAKTVPTNIDVDGAIAHLNDVIAQAKADDPDALTKDIQQATTELHQKVIDTATAAAKAVITKPVTHEDAVEDAQKELDVELQKGDAATGANINRLTTALKAAQKTASDERGIADTNASAAIVDADKQKTNPDVLAAINKLATIKTNAANDDEDALTQDIKNATDELNSKVLTATKDVAANAIAATTTAPVTHEKAVDKAKTDLSTEVGRAGATSASIQKLIEVLDTARNTAFGERGVANTDAEAALANAAKQSKNSDVDTAIKKLTTVKTNAAADDADALTQDIKDATNELNSKVLEVTKVAAATMIKTKTAPVTHESAVAKAKADLITEKDRTGATSASIQKLIDALDTTLTTALSDRGAAKNDAAIAITGADKQKTDTDVQTAIHNLNDVIAKADVDDASALTQDIKDATKLLDEKVFEATKDAANIAIATKTAPVTHESVVDTAKQALDAEIKNKNATGPSLQKLIDDLITVQATALGDRNKANAAADTVLDDAKTQQGDPSVDAAFNKLNTDKTNAAADDANALTQNIVEDTKKLHDAIIAAATKAAADVTKQSATAPVTHEPVVIQATQDLKDETKRAGATGASIKKLTDELDKIQKTALGERNTAKDAANDVMTDAGTQKGNTEIDAAVQGLHDLITKADADDAEALTAKIKEETAKLHTKVLDAAKDKTKQVVTMPVSNEPAVIKATTDLAAEVNKGDHATGTNIQKLTEDLKTAVGGALSARQAAEDEAAKTITDAGSQKHDADVNAAIEKLADLVTKSKTDNPLALTSDVKTATDELHDKVIAAANQTAKETMSEVHTAPVTNEDAVIKARTALTDELAAKHATGTSIQKLIDALKSAQQDALADRNDAKADATNGLADADSQKGNSDVKQAIDHLHDVINRANADDAGALTKDVIKAATELHDKVMTAAKDTAHHTVAATRPVTNEADVIKTKGDLEAELKNDKATGTSIQRLTEALAKSLDAALDARRTAKVGAASAIAKADSVKTNADVKAAIEALNHLVVKADADDKDALTGDIETATTALQAKVASAIAQAQAATGHPDIPATGSQSDTSSTDVPEPAASNGDENRQSAIPLAMHNAPSNDHHLVDTDGKNKQPVVKSVVHKSSNATASAKVVRLAGKQESKVTQGLPQTGDEKNSALTVLGLVSIGLLGLISISKVRKGN